MIRTKHRFILLLLTVTIILVSVFWPAGVAADTMVSVKARISPPNPAVGDKIDLEVRVVDNRAAPVVGAKVVALFSMDPRENPSMPSMDEFIGTIQKPIRVPALPSDRPGEYTITTELGMKGRWRAQVWVSGAGNTSGKTSLDLTVLENSPSSDVNWIAVISLSLFATSIAGLILFLSRKRNVENKEQAERADLLHYPLLRKFVHSRFYPGIFQWPTLVVFAAIVYLLLAGPLSAHDNLGIALTWILWWPVLPLLFVVLGRFWCTVCPMSALGDLVQRLIGRGASPPAFLRKWGIWFIFVAFIIVTWLDLVAGLTEVPRYSAYLLLLVAGGVIFTGVLYQRRTWCRYLCFIGGLCGNYAMASSLELRARRDLCDSCKTYECVRGSAKSAGCPMYEFPRTMTSNRCCNLCGNCIKSCPHDSVRISFRSPVDEVSKPKRERPEEALLAAMLLAMVMIQTLIMLDIWNSIYGWLQGNPGIASERIAYTVVYFMALAAAAGGVIFFSLISSLLARERLLVNFLGFSYALIPLGLAAHAAHNMNHLFGEGLALLETTARLLGQSATLSLAILNVPTIQLLQYIIVGCGLLLSLFAARGIASHASKAWTVAIPHFVMILVIGLSAGWMFSQRMSPRMQMSEDVHSITPAQIEMARTAVQSFEGRKMSLEFVHLEEHGYQDIILRSGADYFFVDSRNNMVVSKFSSQPRLTSIKPIPKHQARAIALDFALEHYPSFIKRQLQPVEKDDSESPFPDGYVFEWREFVNGVPTPNYVKIITDARGRAQIYSAREVEVIVPSTPRIDEATALATARRQLNFSLITESAKLDIGPEITGMQLLRWTITAEGLSSTDAPKSRRERAEVVVDALSGEVMSVVRWG